MFNRENQREQTRYPESSGVHGAFHRAVFCEPRGDAAIAACQMRGMAPSIPRNCEKILCLTRRSWSKSLSTQKPKKTRKATNDKKKQRKKTYRGHSKRFWARCETTRSIIIGILGTSRASELQEFWGFLGKRSKKLGRGKWGEWQKSCTATPPRLETDRLECTLRDLEVFS